MGNLHFRFCKCRENRDISAAFVSPESPSEWQGRAGFLGYLIQIWPRNEFANFIIQTDCIKVRISFKTGIRQNHQTTVKANPQKTPKKNLQMKTGSKTLPVFFLPIKIYFLMPVLMLYLFVRFF